jgi:hypothetical protein
MLTIKCFQFLVFRNKVEKLKNSKKGEKTLCNYVTSNPSQNILRLAYLSIKSANSYHQMIVLPPPLPPPPLKIMLTVIASTVLHRFQLDYE